MNNILKQYYLRMKRAERVYWNNKTESNFKTLVITQQNYINMRRGVQK